MEFIMKTDTKLHVCPIDSEADGHLRGWNQKSPQTLPPLSAYSRLDLETGPSAGSSSLGHLVDMTPYNVRHLRWVKNL